MDVTRAERRRDATTILSRDHRNALDIAGQMEKTRLAFHDILKSHNVANKTFQRESEIQWRQEPLPPTMGAVGIILAGLKRTIQRFSSSI